MTFDVDTVFPVAVVVTCVGVAVFGGPVGFILGGVALVGGYAYAWIRPAPTAPRTRRSRSRTPEEGRDDRYDRRSSGIDPTPAGALAAGAAAGTLVATSANQTTVAGDVDSSTSDTSSWSSSDSGGGDASSGSDD